MTIGYIRIWSSCDCYPIQLAQDPIGKFSKQILIGFLSFHYGSDGHMKISCMVMKLSKSYCNKWWQFLLLERSLKDFSNGPTLWAHSDDKSRTTAGKLMISITVFSFSFSIWFLAEFPPTVDPCSNGPATNGISPITDASSWSLQVHHFYFLLLAITEVRL